MAAKFLGAGLATISSAGAGAGIGSVFNRFLTALAKNLIIENKLFVYLFIIFFVYIYYWTHSSVVYALGTTHHVNYFAEPYTSYFNKYYQMYYAHEASGLVFSPEVMIWANKLNSMNYFNKEISELFFGDGSKEVGMMWKNNVMVIFPFWPDISYYETYKAFGSYADHFFVEHFKSIREQYGPKMLEKILRLYTSRDRFYVYDYLICYSAEQPPIGDHWKEGTILYHTTKLDPKLLLQIADTARAHPDYTSQYNPRWGRGYIVTKPKPWMADGPSLFPYGDRIGYTFVGLLATTIIFIIYSNNKG